MQLLELLLVLVPGFGVDSSIMGRYHRLSHQYILPVGLSDCIAAPPQTSSPATAKSSTDRIVLKSLEVRHDNIIKHATALQAWEAWVAYTITSDSESEKALARSGYLVTP